jgi:hypothetical protein
MEDMLVVGSSHQQAWDTDHLRLCPLIRASKVFSSTCISSLSFYELRKHATPRRSRTLARSVL